MENPVKNWINWPLGHAILSLLEVLPVRADSVGTAQEETGNPHCKAGAHLAALLLGTITPISAVHRLLPRILYCCRVSREEICDFTPICIYLHRPSSQSRIFIFGSRKDGFSDRDDGQISGEAEGLNLQRLFELLNSGWGLELFVPS